MGMFGTCLALFASTGFSVLPYVVMLFLWINSYHSPLHKATSRGEILSVGGAVSFLM